MRTFFNIIPVASMLVLSGCHMDVMVDRERLAEVGLRCVHIGPLASANEPLAQVVRDVLEKEFMRREMGPCTAEEATLLMSGSIDALSINTTRKKFLGPLEETSRESISSVSLVVKDREGSVVLSMSFDNQDRHSAIHLGRMLGRDLAKKLR
jgi:hypothetical protein